MRKVFLILIWNPSSCNLPPAVCSHPMVPYTKSNTPLLKKTASWILKTEDTASLALFCPPSLHALRPVSPSWSFSVNTSTLSGSELNIPRLLQQHSERPVPFLWMLLPVWPHFVNSNSARNFCVKTLWSQKMWHYPWVWFPPLYSVLILKKFYSQHLAHPDGHLLKLEDGQAEAGEKQNSFWIP